MIYFLKTTDGFVRVGGSDGDKRRMLSQIRSHGYTLLAARPGTMGDTPGTDEGNIHGQFADQRVRPSTYDSPELLAWVTWMLDHGYASPDLDEWRYLPDMPQKAWDWNRAREFTDKQGNQTLFDVMFTPMERLEMAGKRVWLSSQTDEWLTPPDVINHARAVLGGAISTDPASNYKANRWIQAATWYDRKTDGLDVNHPWGGTVWLNPPYGRDGASRFVTRLVDELREGHVTAAITCLNLNSACSHWFDAVWENATAHLIWRGRIDFIKPEESQDSSPSKGTILSYFGSESEMFEAEFKALGKLFR